MSTWSDQRSELTDACIAAFGDAGPLLYSRPASGSFSAVAQFSLQGIFDTSGEFASSTGPAFGQAYVKISDIPLGPQRGDLIIPTVGLPALVGRIYRVEESFPDFVSGDAELKVRWTGV